MIVTIHQPDLLPYTGFWYKMARADVFVLSVHDQFQKHGYQRRVTMRERWCSHQLVGKPSLVPINTVQVADGWQQRLSDIICGRYRGARNWDLRGPDLLGRLAQCEGRTLDQVNIELIEVIRDLLGISTPIIVQATPPLQAGVDRVIEQVLREGGDEYLAGTGGAAYMGDDAEERFASQGIRLSWSQHQHSSPDSILTALFDDELPLETVRRERTGAA